MFVLSVMLTRQCAKNDYKIAIQGLQITEKQTKERLVNASLVPPPRCGWERRARSETKHSLSRIIGADWEATQQNSLPGARRTFSPQAQASESSGTSVSQGLQKWEEAVGTSCLSLISGTTAHPTSLTARLQTCKTDGQFGVGFLRQQSVLQISWNSIFKHYMLYIAAMLGDGVRKNTLYLSMVANRFIIYHSLNNSRRTICQIYRSNAGNITDPN